MTPLAHHRGASPERRFRGRLSDGRKRTTRVLNDPHHGIASSPRDMPLEAKRFRHVAVAISEVAVGGFVTTCPRQQCSQPQQPDVAYHQTFFGWRGR
jgi:hypothetical protein